MFQIYFCTKWTFCLKYDFVCVLISVCQRHLLNATLKLNHVVNVYFSLCLYSCFPPSSFFQPTSVFSILSLLLQRMALGTLMEGLTKYLRWTARRLWSSSSVKASSLLVSNQTAVCDNTLTIKQKKFMQEGTHQANYLI